MSPSLTAMKEWLSPIWTVAELQLERGKQWLMPRQQVAFVVAGVVIVLLLLMFSGVTAAVAAVAAWIALLRHFAQTEHVQEHGLSDTHGAQEAVQAADGAAAAEGRAAGRGWRWARLRRAWRGK